MDMMGPMTGWWLVMMAFGLLVIVGIIFLVLWLATRLSPPAGPSSSAGGDDPLTILQRRYARGEIPPEEYERIRADLARR